jgi:hypothetical protein
MGCYIIDQENLTAMIARQINLRKRLDRAEKKQEKKKNGKTKKKIN